LLNEEKWRTSAALTPPPKHHKKRTPVDHHLLKKKPLPLRNLLSFLLGALVKVKGNVKDGEKPGSLNNRGVKGQTTNNWD